MLRHAIETEAFAFELIGKLRKSLDASQALTRDDCQGAAALVRAWEQAQIRVAHWKGVPGPGSRRPLPDEPRKPKLTKIGAPTLVRRDLPKSVVGAWERATGEPASAPAPPDPGAGI